MDTFDDTVVTQTDLAALAAVFDEPPLDYIAPSDDPASPDPEVDEGGAGLSKVTAEKRARIRALVEWDQLSRNQRRSMGIAETDKEWAATNKLNVRRLSKYRSDPFYGTYTAEVKRVAKLRIAPEGSVSLANMPVSGSSGVDDVADYQQIKAGIATLAKEGDPKAVEAWMKHWGHAFRDEEIAGRVKDLAGLADDELVAQLVGMVSPLLLVEVLVAAGWTVVAPDDGSVPVGLLTDGVSQ